MYNETPLPSGIIQKQSFHSYLVRSLSYLSMMSSSIFSKTTTLPLQAFFIVFWLCVHDPHPYIRTSCYLSLIFLILRANIRKLSFKKKKFIIKLHPGVSITNNTITYTILYTFDLWTSSYTLHIVEFPRSFSVWMGGTLNFIFIIFVVNLAGLHCRSSWIYDAK